MQEMGQDLDRSTTLSSFIHLLCQTNTSAYLSKEVNSRPYLRLILIAKRTIHHLAFTDAPFFMHQINDHHTHFDLPAVRDFGGTIRLIQDGKPNALFYREGFVCGNRIFKPYIDRISALRKAGCRLAKLLLATLWGALCQERTFKDTVNGNYDIVASKSLHGIHRNTEKGGDFDITTKINREIRFYRISFFQIDAN